MGRIMSVVAATIIVFGLLVHPINVHPVSAQQRNMTIGMTNWAENIAVANLWTILLEERGYQPELRSVDRVLAFSGLAQGRHRSWPRDMASQNRQVGHGPLRQIHRGP